MVVVEPVLERMIAVAPLLQFLDAHAIPHLVFVNKMDRSEVRYRDLLQTLRDLSARPVIPHQYAIGRGEDLVGYVDLVSEEAHAFRPRPGLRRHPGAGRVSASASRRPAARCWRRWPTSTTT